MLLTFYNLWAPFLYWGYSFLSHLTWEVCVICLRNTIGDDYITQQQSQKYFPSLIYFLQCGISLINSWHICFSVSYWLGRCSSDVLIWHQNDDPYVGSPSFLFFWDDISWSLITVHERVWRIHIPDIFLWVHKLARLFRWLQAKSTRCVSEWESLQIVTLSYWITRVSLSEARNHRVEST